MSGLFKSTLIKGNRITDFTQTTATVGVVIPFLYGRAPVDGNVIFAPLPPKENRTVKRQGKGGVKQESFTYTMSYAIAFCRGPIYGYWWIKRNGKIVWTNDPNAPIEDQAYAAKWAQKATFYYGTSSQLPDSTIESHEGSGQVSAFRYLAYVVVEEDDLTDGGGAVPSYEAVPIASPPEFYLTSHPYAQVIYDNTSQNVRPTGGDLRVVLFESDMQEDKIGQALTPTGGELFVVPPPEMIDEVDQSLTPTGGTLFIPPPAYMQPDKVDQSLTPTNGILKVPPQGTEQADPTDQSLTPTGGALTTPVYLNAADKSANITLSGSDLVATRTGAANAYAGVRATQARNASDVDGYYFECVVTAATTSPYVMIGVATLAASLSLAVGGDANGWGYYQELGQKWANNVGTTYGASYTTGDVIGVLLKNGSLYFRKNGVWQNGADPVTETGAAYTGLTGSLYPMVALWRRDAVAHAVTLRFNQASFSGSLPTNVKPWEQ